MPLQVIDKFNLQHAFITTLQFFERCDMDTLFHNSNTMDMLFHYRSSSTSLFAIFCRLYAHTYKLSTRILVMDYTYKWASH